MTDFEFTEGELARGEALFRSPCDFVLGAVAVDGLPADGRPEIAFAGRSNVGKSSLINALTGRKTLARVSVTPGRTRELNFFTLGANGPDGAYLVDMPGYGYAKVSRSAVKGWTRLIEDYLKGAGSSGCSCSARHGLKANDRDTMKLMDESAVSYQGVLTKADKPKLSELEAVIAKTEAELAKHPAAFPHLLVTSAKEGVGIPELRATIAALTSNGVEP
ncbi:GTP-binding protein [Methyloceanibacter stevinii]|uniref:Probable GTP-binding protein EngB n=1 Tax=Methyloceanibacter stevinii TaxID=1774970 RepID=A0A1E3VPQ7_9HYPH|nr:ribosome biogenesis GTP-binding protein YihA/YsxC [Methyloceanibacter stevinii]ODR95505.1 GTP-binding protein [Methyloceanibacter stevinii]